MELLRLAQLYKAKDLSKEEKLELARKIDVNYSIPNDTYKDLQNKSFAGYNCLHLAAMKEDHDFVCELLKLGANPFKQGSQDDQTAIHVAVNVKTNSKGRKIWEINGKLKECQVINTLLTAHVSNNNPFNPKCKQGLSHLHIACMFNCVEAVEFFIKKGESINQVTNANTSWPLNTPLHFAIRYSSVEVAEILLNYGADFNVKNAEGTTPLHMLIERLLNVADYVNMGQFTLCLPYEEELKRLETIARAVIKLKEENNADILDDSGLSMLHLACCLGDPLISEMEILRKVLNDNYDLNEIVNSYSKFWSGWTPLHFAACCSAETFKVLLKHGANITIKNMKGETPLDFCLKRYCPRTIHSILSVKDEFKKILLSDSSTTLLDLLLVMDNMTSFNNYLENLNLIDVTVSSTSPLLPGYSIFHLALLMNERKKFWNDFLEETDTQENFNSVGQIQSCTDEESRLYSDRINACLAKNCCVESKNCDSLTPIHHSPNNLSHLHVACVIGDQAVLKNLLISGANINAKIKKSFQWYKNSDPKSNMITINAESTPLHVAVAFEQLDIINILLDSGADLYATDSQGLMPVHLSMAHESNKIAKLILSKLQQLIELVTKEGLTYMHVAAFAGDSDTIKRLVGSGANVNGSIDVSVPDFLSRFSGKTPLEIATLYSSSREAIQALIEAGAEIYTKNTLQCLIDKSEVDFSQPLVDQLKLNGNVSEPIHSSGLTLLHVACSRFDVEWATELINKGANVNARIRNDEAYKGKWRGYTPLHALLSRKYQNTDSTIQPSANKLGRLLLISGVDVTIDSEDGTALHMAYLYQIQKAKRQAQKRFSMENLIPNHVTPELVQDLGLQAIPQAQLQHPRMELLLNGMHRLRQARPRLDHLQQTIQDLQQAYHQPQVRERPMEELQNALEMLREARRLDNLPPNLNLDKWEPLLLCFMEFTHPTERITMANMQNALDRSNKAQRLLQDLGLLVASEIQNIGEIQDVLERLRDQWEETNQNTTDMMQFMAQILPPGQNVDPIFQEMELLVEGHGQERAWKDSFESSILYSQRSYQNNPISADGFSHFHFFCMTNNTTIVKEFLNNGVDINHLTNPFAETQAGYTALHFAIKYQVFVVANLLLESGANVNIENADGNTPLHLLSLQNLTDSQRDIILSLKRYGANFNAKNSLGETPADFLMAKKNFSLEQLKFLLENGASISVKKCSALPGPAELIMRNTVANERMNIFKLFMSVCDKQVAEENGYSPFQDIVKAKSDHPLNTPIINDFIRALIEFMNVGYEIDQVDEQGFTALQNAILLDNKEAVYALLRLGADINYCNLDNHSFESKSSFLIKKRIALRIHKMHALNLYVSDSNNSIYLKFIEKRQIKQGLQRKVKTESEKAKEIILVGNLTVRAFLSDLWATVYYSKLPPINRQTIDVFFNNYDYLLKQFPCLCGIMISEYKKAVVRPKLIKSAKEVLAAECEFDLPDLCLECILSFVTHYELKYLIENADKVETEVPSKRRRIH